MSKTALQRMRERIVKHDLEFLGEKFLIRNLSGRDRIQLMVKFDTVDFSNLKPEQLGDLQALLFSLLCSQDGKQAFSTEEIDEIMGTFPVSETDVVLAEIMRVNFGGKVEEPLAEPDQSGA